jgi:hypothetical protein
VWTPPAFAATDDLGNIQEFAPAGTVLVTR